MLTSAPDRGLRRLRFLAHPGHLGPRGVKVALGALGAAAQLAGRLLEHLGAGFQRGAQLVALAGQPGEDLVPFPLGVGAQLLELAGRVLSGPRGLGACGVGACLGGGCALVSLRGLRERLVPGVIGGADAGPGLFVAFGW